MIEQTDITEIEQSERAARAQRDREMSAKEPQTRWVEPEPQPQPQPVRPLDEAMARLDLALVAMSNATDLLEDRLAPVLSEETDVPAGPANTASMAESPLLVELADLAYRLEARAGRVRRLADRVVL